VPEYAAENVRWALSWVPSVQVAARRTETPSGFCNARTSLVEHAQHHRDPLSRVELTPVGRPARSLLA
jgi:hypothetical protein